MPKRITPEKAAHLYHLLQGAESLNALKDIPPSDTRRRLLVMRDRLLQQALDDLERYDNAKVEAFSTQGLLP